MNVGLVLCSWQDIPQLHQVAMQSYQEHYLYLWENRSYADWYMNRSFSTASLHEQMSEGEVSFYFIQYEKRNCGFVKLNWNKTVRNETTSMELERMYLLKEVSRKGVGSAAMKIIISLAQEKEKNLVWLKAMDSSPSIHFYEKAGFRKTAVERLPFEGFRDEFRNILLMERKL